MAGGGVEARGNRAVDREEGDAAVGAVGEPFAVQSVTVFPCDLVAEGGVGGTEGAHAVKQLFHSGGVFGRNRIRPHAGSAVVAFGQAAREEAAEVRQIRFLLGEVNF